MGFLSGSVGYECYRTSNQQPSHFDPEHVETLARFAISSKQSVSAEQARVGFLAGEHLLDRDFDLEKNILNDALHFAMRIDSNQVPAAIRKAWLQIELATLRAEAPERRLTKAERQEAKEAVEARCDEAARGGQFLKMQQFPILWDARHSQLYFGGSSAAAAESCRILLKKAFALELEPLSATRLAHEWAAAARRRRALGEVNPAQLSRRCSRAIHPVVERASRQLRFSRQRVPAVALVVLGNAIRAHAIAGRIGSDRYVRPHAHVAVPVGRIGQGYHHGRRPYQSARGDAGDSDGQAAAQSRFDSGTSG